MTGFEQLLKQLTNLFRWWVTVAPWEQGVRVRFGSHAKVLEPGVHLRVPVMHQIYRQSVRLKVVVIPTQTLTTADGKALTVRSILGFAVKDILALFNTLQDVEEVMQGTVQGLVADFVTGRPLAECRPSKLEEYVRDRTDFSDNGLGDITFNVTDFVAVRTYRLIQGAPNDFTWGDNRMLISKEVGS